MGSAFVARLHGIVENPLSVKPVAGEHRTHLSAMLDVLLAGKVAP